MGSLYGSEVLAKSTCLCDQMPPALILNRLVPRIGQWSRLGLESRGGPGTCHAFALLTIFCKADIMICLFFLYRKHSLRKIFAMLFSAVKGINVYISI